MSTASIYVHHEDWTLEVVYENGDKWIVTSPNPEELAETRDREREFGSPESNFETVVSAVIYRPQYRT